jgi:hypothetical protein
MGALLQLPRQRIDRTSDRAAVASAQIIYDPRLRLAPLQRSLSRLADQDPAMVQPASALSIMVRRLLGRPAAIDAAGQRRS